MSNKHYVGIDLGGTNLKASLIDETGEVLDSLHRPSRLPGGRDALRENLLGAVRDLISPESPYPGQKGEITLAGVGVGVPGILDLAAGTLLTAPHLPEGVNLPIRQMLEEAFEVKVSVDNDANAMALGEFWKGAGQDTQTLVLLTLGTGVGSGIILEGRMWRGAQGKGAEIGHMTILGKGPRCACGSQGCLDALVSSGALLQRAQLEMKKDPSSSLHFASPLTSKAIAQAAHEGDNVAIAVLAKTGYYLGIGLANVANIFNPEMIVLAGGVARAGEVLVRPAEEEMRKRAFSDVTEDLVLKESELGDLAGALGAVYPIVKGIELNY